MDGIESIVRNGDSSLIVKEQLESDKGLDSIEKAIGKYAEGEGEDLANLGTVQTDIGPLKMYAVLHRNDKAGLQDYIAQFESGDFIEYLLSGEIILDVFTITGPQNSPYESVIHIAANSNGISPVKDIIDEIAGYLSKDHIPKPPIGYMHLEKPFMPTTQETTE